MQELWPNIVNHALLGTDRRPFTVPSGEARLLAQLAERPQEEALLAAAAALSVYRRAGVVPPVSGKVPVEPCPPEEMPYCSATAGQHLLMMLNGQYPQALAEWLEVAAAHRRVVLPEQLPALLEAGANRAGIRHLILPVIGRRGQWLAGLNPAWRYAQGTPDDVDFPAAWESAAGDDRLRLLAAWRRKDPAAAREAVIAALPAEKAAGRAALVAALSDGLSMEDEPFLESALDDKSTQVHAHAADLLATLPESRLAGRMLSHLRSLVTISTVQASWIPGFKKTVLQVTLPDEGDPALMRDVAAAKGSYSTIGSRGVLFVQMMRAVPPSTWCRLFSASPDDLIKATSRGEEKDLLKTAWREAAVKHKDAEWAVVLLSLWPTEPNTSGWEQLIHLLTPEQLDRIFTPMVQAEQVKIEQAVTLMLATGAKTGPALAVAVLKALRKYVSSSSSYQYSYALYEMSNLAYFVPAAVLAQVSSDWVTWSGTHPLDNQIDKLIAVLDFRTKMLKEFES
jgi:hypothetical protein